MTVSTALRAFCVTGTTFLAALAAGCGGGGGGGSGFNPPANATCSLVARKQWVLDNFREWYLFPETLPAAVNLDQYATLQDLVDGLTATARAQGKDRFFSFITSIAEEDAFNNSGATTGFGVLLRTDASAGRLFISEAFEGAPALLAGIDRGDEILAIGTTEATLRNVADILATGGTTALDDAIGPSTAGTARALRVANTAGTRVVTVTKQNYSLQPVSSRYGGRILDDAGRQVGYVNLRTYINAANPRLREEFARFRTAGITEVIVDLRYNGGGLVATAGLLGDLMGANRSSGQIFSQLRFRPEKSANDSIKNFESQPEAIAPLKIAVITTGATASASEMTANGMLPYLGTNLAIIGANTFGKPVGQIAVDRAACDDRLRVIAFATRNATNTGDYFNGLAGVVSASCTAADDITRPLGDLQETSIRRALDWLAGQPCTPITAGTVPGPTKPGDGFGAGMEMLKAVAPNAAQQQLPGLF